MPERRKQYRVSSQWPQDLSVVVVKSWDREVPGQIANLCVGGMGVFFDDRLGGVYRIGETVYLRVSSPQMKEPLVVPCLVHHREQATGGQLYGLKFADWMGLLSRLPPSLAALFNRRRACRFEPDPTQPIPLMVGGTTLPFEIQATLRDLSMDGLSFRAAPLAEVALAKTDEIAVSFVLPTNSRLLTFVGRIRHRSLVGGGIAYGVLFDPERTPLFQESEEELTGFIQELEKQTFAHLAEPVPA